MRRLREYLRQCEMAFDLAPDTYVTEEVKVKWAAQFLKGETQDTWYRHVDSINVEAEAYLTWARYKEFLKKLLQDPVTSVPTLARRYDEAYQKPGQSVATFVSYLDSIE